MRLAPPVLLLAFALAITVFLQGGVSLDLGDVARRLMPLAGLAALIFFFRRSVASILVFALVVAATLVPPYVQAQQLSPQESGAILGASFAGLAGLMLAITKLARGRSEAHGAGLFTGLFALSAWTAAFVVYDAGNLILGAWLGALGVSGLLAGIVVGRSAAGLACLRDTHYSMYLTLLVFGALYGGIGLTATAAAAVLPLGAWALASFVPGGATHVVASSPSLDPERDGAARRSKPERLSPAPPLGR